MWGSQTFFGKSSFLSSRFHLYLSSFSFDALILSFIFSFISSLLLSFIFSLLSSLLFSCLVSSLAFFSCPLVLSRLLLFSIVLSLFLSLFLCLSFSVFFLCLLSLSLSVSLCPRLSLSPCVVVVVVVVVVSCVYVVVVVVCACCVVGHAENLRVYIQNVPVCTGTTPACGNTTYTRREEVGERGQRDTPTPTAHPGHLGLDEQCWFLKLCGGKQCPERCQLLRRNVFPCALWRPPACIDSSIFVPVCGVPKHIL